MVSCHQCGASRESVSSKFGDYCIIKRLDMSK